MCYLSQRLSFFIQLLRYVLIADELSCLLYNCFPLLIILDTYLTELTSSWLLHVMNLIGDVKGKVAVMVDDMIDMAGTIAKGAALLHQEGAREVYACCTHAVFKYAFCGSNPVVP